jgi:hypothetical protein
MDKNNPTIKNFKCEKCGKEEEVQCVGDLLLKICSDCHLKNPSGDKNV